MDSSVVSHRRATLRRPCCWALVRLDDVIRLEGVNEVARELLGFFAEYGKAPSDRDPLGGLTTAIVVRRCTLNRQYPC